MRNSDVVAQEIEALGALKPRVRHYSFFGDDNREAIAAQITVLSRLWDEDKVYEVYGSDTSDSDSNNILDAALSAVQWLYMETEDVPSEDWQSLVIKTEDE